MGNPTGYTPLVSPPQDQTGPHQPLPISPSANHCLPSSCKLVLLDWGIILCYIINTTTKTWVLVLGRLSTKSLLNIPTEMILADESIPPLIDFNKATHRTRVRAAPHRLDYEPGMGVHSAAGLLQCGPRGDSAQKERETGMKSQCYIQLCTLFPSRAISMFRVLFEHRPEEALDLKSECVLVRATVHLQWTELLIINKHGKMVLDKKTFHSARKLLNDVLNTR